MEKIKVIRNNTYTGENSTRVNKKVAPYYEDILVQKYLKEIQTKNDLKSDYQQQQNIILNSPYLQKVSSHTYIKRIQSTERTSSRHQHRRHQYDHENVVTCVQKQDNETNSVRSRSESRVRRTTLTRPVSAPIIRTQSEAKRMHTKRLSSAKLMNSSSYRKKQVILKALTFKNGSNENPILITSHTIKHFLEAATTKLNLHHAARRIFTLDGTEIIDARGFKNCKEVFVSCGEEFIDPFFKEKELIRMRKEATWTMDGVRVRTDSAERERQEKSNLSDDDLNSIHGVQIVTAFENGKSNDPTIVDFDFDICDTDSDDSGRDSDFDYDEVQMKEFLQKCSTKFEFNAKVVYDWFGNQIKSLDDIPKFNEFVTITNHIELTPIWVSKGERFDPYGPLRYVTMFINFEKQLLRDLSDENAKKLKTLKNSTKREFQNLNINSYIGDDIKQIKRLINYLSNLKEKLSDLDKTYEKIRSNILMQHIKEVSTTDRIFGGLASKGLKLEIYVNGNDTNGQKLYFNCKDSMNEKNRSEVGVKLLLDEINRVMQNNRASGVRFTRIFDENGIEKKNLFELKRDEKIWVSAGENWKTHLIKALNMSFHTLNFIKNENAPVSASADSLQVGKVKDYKRSTFWNAFDLHELLHKIQNNEITVIMNSGTISKNVELSEIHCFLQCKSQENLVMFPRLSFDEKIYLHKKDEENKEKEAKPQKNQFTVQDNSWLKNQFQQWSFHEDGIISNHYFPQLCLSLDPSVEVQLELQLVNREKNKKSIQSVVLSGYPVTLKLRQTNDKANRWILNSMGNIINQTTGDRFALSSMDILSQKLDQCKTKGYLNEFKFNCSNPAMLNENHMFNIQLIVLDKFGYSSWLASKLSTSQRWAIKQENMQTIGQWRHSKLATPEWHKLAYTWPVNEQDELIDDFDWPIVGYLIPNAPPLKTIINSSFFDYPRLSLKVLKNGELNDANAATINTPDVRHLMKEYANCTKITIKQLEFNWFLDNCTSTLNLPFAGRRLFDQHGNEYFDLHSFKNVKVEGIKFYVTCGEAWIDPRLCREEIDTKTKLLRLIEDYKKLFHYCCLKSCTHCDLVIETFETLEEGSPLVISPCVLTKDQRRRLDKGESIQAIIEHLDTNDHDEEQDEKKTAHQRSHDRVSASKKMKWPWENIANKSMENLVAKNEESVEVVQSVNKSFQQKKPKNLRKFNLQKFNFNTNTGYIYSTENSQLVFGVQSSEGNVNEVILMRRNDSDVNQRWMFKDNIIALKARPHLVLTVQCASFDQILTNLKVDLENDKCIMELKESSFEKFLVEAAPEVFTGSAVTLQRYVKTDAGGCTQKWHYEDKTGFIFAFKSHEIDIAVTSAIQANICTFNVLRSDVSQPGYSCVLVTEDANEKIKKTKKTICLACARDTRGKYKLTKLSDKFDFSCDANKDNTFHKLTGFRYLSNKHDMTVEQLFLKCRDDYVLMTKKRVQSVPLKLDERVEYLLKFLVHKNGHDHPNYFKNGEYIHGTNIKVVFDQATQKLGLSNAARKLYTIDGTPILDYQDLVNYCQLFYKKVIENMHERAKSLTESRYLKIKQDKIYESGPNLYELENLFENEDEIDTKTLLKWPIHVWVSSGEAFINPNTATKNQELKKNHRKRIEEPGNKLDTQTHVLRNMTGRRFKTMEPGTLRPVQNPDYPVVKEGHWSNVPYEEQLKQIEVEELKTEFDKLKAPTKEEKAASSSLVNKSLYDTTAKKKRVLIYANGETPDKAIKCWASSLDELIESSKVQLRLNKPVKFIYSQDGKIVLKLEDLEQDQLLCVSTGAQFIKSEDRNKEIESKANWSRVRRTEGERATHIQVVSSQNPIIDVDPFGPPLVATKNTLTYPEKNEEHHENNENNYDNDSDSSSKRLKNLRFQHQNNKKALNNDSLLD